MKKQRKDIWVIGFALFSMFFGAGNMIFPPYLGLETGTDWVTGFLSFTFADAGLALVAIVALVFGSGSLEGMLRPLGKVPSVLLSIACYLCIGPLLAIPRTAASTFELAIAPSFSFGPVPFSFLFFILVFAFTIRPNRVVDILGKILTPALYLSLLILIIRGIATPIGPIAETGFDGAFLSGLMVGYQTMDVIASVVFIILITNTLENRGYAGKEKVKITILSGVVATIGMMVVYGGLTYLGATATNHLQRPWNFPGQPAAGNCSALNEQRRHCFIGDYCRPGLPYHCNGPYFLCGCLFFKAAAGQVQLPRLCGRYLYFQCRGFQLWHQHHCCFFRPYFKHNISGCAYHDCPFLFSKAFARQRVPLQHGCRFNYQHGYHPLALCFLCPPLGTSFKQVRLWLAAAYPFVRRSRLVCKAAPPNCIIYPHGVCRHGAFFLQSRRSAPVLRASQSIPPCSAPWCSCSFAVFYSAPTNRQKAAGEDKIYR